MEIKIKVYINDNNEVIICVDNKEINILNLSQYITDRDQDLLGEKCNQNDDDLFIIFIVIIINDDGNKGKTDTKYTLKMTLVDNKVNHTEKIVYIKSNTGDKNKYYIESKSEDDTESKTKLRDDVECSNILKEIVGIFFELNEDSKLDSKKELIDGHILKEEFDAMQKKLEKPEQKPKQKMRPL